MIDFSRLKICFLAGTLGQGGAERQLFYILNTLKNEGAKIEVICLTKGELYEEKIQSLGIKVHYAGASSSRLLRLIKIISILREIKPDIIQSHHFYTNIYAALASKATGIKGIGASRNNIDKEIQINGRVLGKLSFRLPEFMIANSKESINIAIKLGKDPKKIFYLPNGVDTNRFKPLSSENNIGAVKIINIGRNVPFKRQWLFINLIEKIVKKTEIKIEGHIVGDGPENANLKSLALGKGLFAGQFFFHGDVLDPEHILQKSDIFVLTSEYEGTPNVVLEAMSCGLAVVCASVGNLPNFIDDKVNGFLVDEANIEKELYEKVCYLIENKDFRINMGRKGRETILKEFSFDALAGLLNSIYEFILID